MATRHNACVNPACDVDVAGWGGGSTPARVSVSGFGRPFGARYTSGTFNNTARGAVAGGQPAILSVYAYLDVAGTAGGVTYIEWRDASQSVITYSPAGFSVPGRTVARISNTNTAPSNAAYASLIVEFNFGGGNSDFSMVLIEAGSTLGDYFDGDTSGAVWDGTPGSSASTLPDEVVEGVLAVTLPPLQVSLTAVVTVQAELSFTLPAIRASFTGVSDVVPIRPGVMSPHRRAGVTATGGQRRGTRMEGA